MASRKPDCHPDEKHVGHGLCQRCYNARYHATIRKGAIKNHGSVYPQEHFRLQGGPKGWGYL